MNRHSTLHQISGICPLAATTTANEDGDTSSVANSNNDDDKFGGGGGGGGGGGRWGEVSSFSAISPAWVADVPLPSISGISSVRSGIQTLHCSAPEKLNRT